MTIDEMLGPILGTPEGTLTLDDSPETIPSWDSATQVEVVLAVEEAVGKDLSAAEIFQLTSIHGIVDLLRSHGVDVTV
jgi:acyl carrier protein